MCQEQMNFALAFIVQIDAHHKKTDIRIFVVVIPKEGLAGRSPAPAHQSFFGYDNDKDLKRSVF